MKTILFFLAACLIAALPVRARQDLLLENGWKFVQQDAGGAEAVAFDDAAWTAVSVPHCWNIAAGESGDKAHFYEGPGWYRLHIKPDAAAAGKSFFLKFDAAYHSAQVFLNGKLVGEHVGGFQAFCFDVTKWMRAGQDNVLAVKVSYEPLSESPPMGGDFTKFPGIYRRVHLLVLDPLGISPLDDASPGVYLKQVHVDDSSAEVEITTKLRNGNDAAKKATVRCRLLDASGKELQTISAEESVPANGNADSVQTMKISSPHLWNGKDDPYLHHVVVEIDDGAKPVDRVEQPLGLRYFVVDPVHGFFLNGKEYSLHGVNRHQQRPGKGWAISDANIEQDVGIMNEMGCTTIRTCHYQHSDELHALCDKEGIVVWSELDMVNGVHFDSPDFVRNTRRQLSELIKQNYNHPSICFWSLWNEMKIPKADEKDKMTRFLDFIRDLNALAKQLDPTRLTTGASCCGAYPPMTLTDIAAWNGYPGWYGGHPDGWPKILDEVRSKVDGHALGVSEYGAGASIFDHELDENQAHPGGHFHPEEWQALVHESNYGALKQAHYLWGTYIWVMFDFASIGRREGDHDGVNDKGLVTADRATRKDAFYFYQAQWTTNPLVHINSRRFNPHPTGKTKVKVYSNCDRVELYFNGKSLGTQTGDDRVFIWPDVDLPEGANTIDARATVGTLAVTDTITWNCSPSASHHLGPIDTDPPPKKKKK